MYVLHQVRMHAFEWLCYKMCYLYAVVVPTFANQLNLDSSARNNYKKFQQSPNLQK